ncbi:hypothetical protein FNV43_RR26404 [Rhamnella rubrinervis]|uniref:Cytochrome P450 n=1 Tax=Rhamnella rubrinervis TaxID=2594499 RepID=A0A8K0DIH8_9ROSA|nr:hypothetical protein FNV43_RR26404 [Rhamnella rubrinervis]
MADKHGPIFSLRLGQKRTLVVSSWEVVKECFTTNDRIFANRPSIAVGKYVGYNNAIFALAPYGQYWRDIRKLATLELLSAHRLELLKHVRASEVDLFIKELFTLSKSSSAKHNVAVPLSELLEHLTFNINLRLIAGKRFSASMYEEKNSEVTRLNNAIKETLYLSGVFVWSDAIPWLEWLDIHGHVRSMKRTFKEIDFVLKEDVMSAGHTRDTVIKATALILTLTGTESTAVTLTWTLSLLLNNPSALKSAQEELDTQVGRDRWVQESDIHNLKYLQAVVKESLRLNPPGPITGPREATEDCYIGNHFVPKGTRLAVNIWKLQRDPQIWSDPCEFRPERFMTTHADLGLKGVLARLLQGFDIRTKGGEPVDMREGLGIALPKASPLEVVLAPRLPLQLYECL